jgi:predicted DNA-binding protein
MQKLRATFTLSDFLIDELNSVSDTLGEKKSHIVEKALSLYFDYLDETIADKRLKKLENGETEKISADDVWKELGI